jgi:hypothetical protein
MILRSQPATYFLIVLVLSLGTTVFRLRHDGIFACGAGGYSSSSYLSYCQATSYGDYDHGAIWFGLEPEVDTAASRADVLVLGNSRTQFALSTAPFSAWFTDNNVSYYLLGFSYNGNYNFARPLLAKLKPRARVYVINLDLFFEEGDTPPAAAVLHDRDAANRYTEKRRWQTLHRGLCQVLRPLCGNEPAFFRTRATGVWTVYGEGFHGAPVAYDTRADPAIVKRYATEGRAFLAGLPVPPECIILTTVPTKTTGIATAQAIAESLHTTLYAPELDSLTTFDGSHLDRSSAARWSAALAEAMGPRIRSCLDRTTTGVTATP